MCGIAAVWQRGGGACHEEHLMAMRDALWHRGPDDAGIRCDGPVGLAHRRLSILDLSPAGHQPMCNEDGTVWVVFNGEIYNYVELAQPLRARGHVFRSQSDTEVLVHLWEDEGPAMLQRLNGMFAIVVWDARTRTMFVARDRIGIKPVYYHDGPGLFAVASEVKALLAHPAIPTAMDRHGLADYFFAGAPLGSRTMFDGIRQLPPAHALTVTDQGAQVARWWDVRYAYRHGVSPDDRLAELGTLVDDAVRIHCRSDADVGCHLSGGLDSSLVASLAARHRGRMDAFSVRFGGGAFYDELPYAAAVAEAMGARHHIVTPEAADLGRLLGALTYHQDVPIPDTAGFSYYAVSRLAAGHVKVALTGHGGDEVFGGYPAQFQTAFGTTSMFDLSKRPAAGPGPGRRRLWDLLRREGLDGVRRRMHARATTLPGVDGEWVRQHCGPVPGAHPLLARGFVRSVRDYSPVDEYLRPFREAPTDDLFDRCLYHDLVQYLPTLLMKEDRASMAVSIESRVPLLDYRIIEYMATVPSAEKVPGRVPKALLRKVAEQHVPARVVARDDKTPFPVPLQEWFGRELRPMAERILRSEASLERGIFAPAVLRDPALGVGDLLTMLNVEVWCRVFLDRDPAWRPAGPATVRAGIGGLAALAS